MTEDTQRRRPGRPATGHAPTRSVRIGAVWDEAMIVANSRGEALSRVITRALETYVCAHSPEGGDAPAAETPRSREISCTVGPPRRAASATSP